MFLGTPLASSALASAAVAGGEEQMGGEFGGGFIELEKGITVLIDGLDFTDSYSPGSLTIEDNLGSRNTCSFRFEDPTNRLSVAVGEEVQIFLDDIKIFGGTIETVQFEFPSFDQLSKHKVFFIECVDFNQIADRHLVAAAFETPGQTAGDIVRTIIEDHLKTDGVTDTAVQDGLVVGSVKFDYQSAAAAISELAALIGFDWCIDYNRNLQFFSRTSIVSPFSITDSTRNYNRLRCRETREEYRNKQILRAGRDVGAARVRSFKGDGETTTFTVEYPIAEEPTVKVNAATKTVGIRGVDDDDDPAGFDWFWSQDTQVVSQNRQAAALSTSDTLEITYKPFLPLFIESTDLDEVQARQIIEGGSGIYSAIKDDRRIIDGKHANDVADGLVRKFGNIPCIVEIETDVGGLRAGQLLTISLSNEALNADYLITNVTVTDLGGDFVRYQVAAADGENLGGWQEFFKRLKEQGREFTIRGDEVLVLIHENTSAIQFSDDSSGTATGDNLDPEANDDDTVGLIGTAVVGSRYFEELAFRHQGSEVGS